MGPPEGATSAAGTTQRRPPCGRLDLGLVDWICALNDQFDIELDDPEQLEEIEIMTRLIVAASQSDSPLARADIDRILGPEGD